MIVKENENIIKGDEKYDWEQTAWQPTYGAFSNTAKFGSMILK